MSSARDDLLARIVDDVAHHGLGDRSLRDLAAAVGSSHRMLLYHFGSREGLVAAIVSAVERSQRELLVALATEVEGRAELIRALWRQVSSPELRPFVRLFFESLSYASGTGATDQTAPWLDDTVEVTSMLGVDHDPVEIRLGVAVVRGLLVDVLATDQVAEATASLERFIALWEAGA